MDLVVIAHNLRSAHNVGSLLRTAEGLGVGKIYLTGYSPYPQRETARETDNSPDSRLPHQAAKIDRQITKTALGAEKTLDWQHEADIFIAIKGLKNLDYVIAALEQAPNSMNLPSYQPPEKLAIILGREAEGLESDILKACDLILEIPMLGQKESFNVVQAAAMALYHCRYAKGV